MMESIALTESHIVEEEDYVLVSLGSLDDDDDSFDHCDDDSIASTCDASTSSYSISISENFKNSTPHLMSLIEEATDVSIVSSDDSSENNFIRGTSSILIEGECINPAEDPECEEKQCDQTSKEESYETHENIREEKIEEASEVMCEEKCEETHQKNHAEACGNKKDLDEKKEDEPSKTRVQILVTTTLIEANEVENKEKIGGSRLSNKKRRKKMKLMKKAAAAATAAAALAEMKVDPPPAIQQNSVISRPKSKSRSKSKRKGQRSNIAVVCATESIAQYRDEHKLKALPTPNYMSLL
mmetsp:Transcript_3676/g.5410  ORF Transcript_3676/g.5410 Transcript_3676/m.5410 type:complete len:298 (+) Transcript_3676:85-978(+)